MPIRISDRAQMAWSYNFGLERSLTRDLTIAINYVGNETIYSELYEHWHGNTARGYWSNQLNRFSGGTGAYPDSTCFGLVQEGLQFLRTFSPNPSGLTIPAFLPAAAAIPKNAGDDGLGPDGVSRNTAALLGLTAHMQATSATAVPTNGAAAEGKPHYNISYPTTRTSATTVHSVPDLMFRTSRIPSRRIPYMDQLIGRTAR